MPAFILSFGLSQLFYGPASDRFGRKPVIIFGLMVFLIGTAMSYMAQSVEMVILGRIGQGLGAGAAPVVGRAILRDTHSGEKLARAMAMNWAIFGVGIITAPLLGYWVISLGGWPLVFVSIGALGAYLLIYGGFFYRETNNAPDRAALHPSQMINAACAVFSHHQSRYFMVCAVFAYCALLTYITNAPRLYQQAFGVEGFGFSAFFAFTGIGIIIGQFANRSLIVRLGVLNVLRLASLIIFIACVSIGLSIWLGFSNPYVFTGLMFMFNTSFLVIVSNTATLTLHPHPKIAGLTSSIFGLMTNGLGGIFVVLTITPIAGLLDRWALAMTAMTTLCLLMTVFYPANRIEFHEN